MKHLLRKWLITALAVLSGTYLLPGISIIAESHSDQILVAILVAFCIGIINGILKPILSLLTLPISIITLGISKFILNVGLILIIPFIVNDFVIENFLWAFIFSILIVIIDSIFFENHHK